MCLFFSCSPSSENEQTALNTPPTASDYIAPFNNQICTGEIISADDIQVTFEWEAFQDAEDTNLTYAIEVRNLLNNAIAHQATLSSTNSSATLARGLSFSWQVTATDSEGESVAGDTWLFQTPDEGVNNYAPFPAELLAPENGQVFVLSQNNDVNYSWIGHDPDPGETSQLTYDLYLGQTNPPPLYYSNISPYIGDILGYPGVYYWKVVTKDPHGNTSESEVRQLIAQDD